MRPIVFVVVMVALLALAKDELPGTAPPDAASAETRQDPATADAEEGLASYYWRGLDGRTTASGEPFDADAMVAAHPRLPFDTRVRVTNLENGRTTTVRIVDRGPVKRIQREGVIIDLSPAAAKVLGFVKDGRTKVRVEILELGADA
jgi:rare lipoprotein A